MILKQHPDHDYRRMQPDKLVPFTNNVIAQTGSNVVTFGAASTVLVTSLTTQIAILVTKNAAYKPNPLLHGAMETQRKVVVKLLNKLNQLVDGIADGDAGIIDLSGFHKTSAESTPGIKPTVCVIHDQYPEGKGGYYVQVDPKPHCTFIFIICALDATVTIVNNQVNVSKGPFSQIIDTHPHAEFANIPSGDQKLVIIALNAAGMSLPTAPVTVSIP
ncbi:MAG: hypothetical protein WCL14_04305 [Bacteroidota bacterium]